MPRAAARWHQLIHRRGFDCPALDTLFLAAPITFKNRLVQYVECLTRLHPATATVHDIHDELTPVFADM